MQVPKDECFLEEDESYILVLQVERELLDDWIFAKGVTFVSGLLALIILLFLLYLVIKVVIAYYQRDIEQFDKFIEGAWI